MASSPSPRLTAPRLRRAGVLALPVLVSLLALRPCSAQSDFYAEDYVPELKLTFAFDDWHSRLKSNFDTGNYVAADLLLDGVLYPQVGVQYKGDASYTGKVRENTKITLDAFVPGQNHLGFDVITLDAGRQSSVFHEVVSLWCLGEFLIAPRANLAHLSMGTEDLMLDVGVFTNTERVDGGFAWRHLGSSGHRYTLADSGNWTMPFDYHGDTAPNYRKYYQVQGGDPSTEFVDYATACVALKDAPRKKQRPTLDPALDIDAILRLLVGFRMVGGVDGFESGNNYYLLEEVLHGSRMLAVPWDQDLTWYLRQDPIPAGGSFPTAKLFEDPVLLSRAEAYVRQILDELLLGKGLENRLRALRDRVVDLILGSKYEDYKTEAQIDAKIDAIVAMIKEIRRAANNDARFQREVPALGALEHSPAAPRADEDIWVAVDVSVATTTLDEVLLWSRSLGPFHSTPMFDDGQHHDGASGDGRFGALLPAAQGGDRVEYYVEARPLDLSLAGYGFLPIRTEFRPQFVDVSPVAGSLRIAEVVLDNDGVLADEAGDFDDYVVLANTGSVVVDLGGFALSDRRFERRFELPSGTVLPAAGRLVVWCDDEAQEGPLHAGFGLAKSGETLFLRDVEAAGGGVLDAVAVPALEQDQAFARVPESGEHWYYVEEPAADHDFLEGGVARRYDRREDGSVFDVRLRVDGSRREGGKVRFEVRDGLPNGLALLWLSAAPAALDLGPLGVLVVDPTLAVRLTLRLDATGDADLEFDVPPGTAGTDVYCQVLSLGQDLTRGSAFRIGS